MVTKDVRDIIQAVYDDDAEAYKVLPVNAAGGVGGPIVIQDRNSTNQVDVNVLSDASFLSGSIYGLWTNSKLWASDGSITTQPLYQTSGSLHTLVKGVGSVVDSDNSTTTTLDASETFTGTGVDLLGYSTVCITLRADVDSAVDGMKFEFSTDNSNWDDSYPFTMDVSDTDTRRFQYPVTARYFRIRYINGGSNQTTFRVQTILHTANQLTSIHRIKDTLFDDNSAQLMLAVLSGKNPGGDYVNFQATTSGNFKMSLEELENAISVNSNTQLRVTQFDSSGNEITTSTEEGETALHVLPGAHQVPFIHLSAENIATTTGFMLVDLSDTTNFPHTNTGHVDIEFLVININASKQYAGDIEIGFLTDVDATNGDFNILWTWHNDQVGTNEPRNETFDVGSAFHQIPCQTTKWFGPTTVNDTTWQTDVNVTGPDGGVGGYPSGSGDLVMKITRTAGNIDVAVSFGYHTHE